MKSSAHLVVETAAAAELALRHPALLLLRLVVGVHFGTFVAALHTLQYETEARGRQAGGQDTIIVFVRCKK